MDFQLRRNMQSSFDGSAYARALMNFHLPGDSPVRPATPTSHEKGLGGGWIVQKFGGTSVGKFGVEIARDIVCEAVRKNRIAIVCSARSSSTKSEGTTNRLLRAAAEAGKPGSRRFVDIVNAIREEHIRAATDSIESSDIIDQLTSEIDKECNGLIKILESAQHLEEVSSRAEDRIVSKGEILSCLFMEALLRDKGVKAVVVNLAMALKSLADRHAHRVDKRDDLFFLEAARSLGGAVREACSDEDSVPVVTGFFGPIPGGLLKRMGRGYTDLCAALVAVGMKAKELQIWKEVDGIFTADPSKVPTARLIPSVTPSEAAELTFYGSEVIHPFTMEQAIRERIPIRIKNVKNPEGRGTIIFPEPVILETPGSPMIRNGSVRFAKPQLPKFLNSGPKRPTAVTVKHDIVILSVASNKKTRAHGFLMNIFRTLDKYHLSVDLISSSEVSVSMALHSESAMMVGTSDEVEFDISDEDLRGAVEELSAYGSVKLVPEMAIVSLVGSQLENMVGIGGRFLRTLGENNINIKMISQGASENNISLVIDEREADRALNVVHTGLFTFLE